MADKVVLTKNDIALKLSENLGITNSEAISHTNEVFKILAQMLKDSNVGDDIKLGNLGVLTTKMTKEGERRNPRTQELVHVDAKKVVKFRMLPKFRTSLNEK